MRLPIHCDVLSRSPALKLKGSLVAWFIIAPVAALALALGGNPRVTLTLVLLAVPFAIFLVVRGESARRGLRRPRSRVMEHSDPREYATLEKTIDLVAFDIRRISDKDYYEEFLHEYFLQMENCVRSAKNSVVVLDYLAHHRSFNAIHGKELARSYATYFRAIEDQVVNQDLYYVRIMQLPLGEVKDLSRRELVYRCVELMYVETLEHIKRMSEEACAFRLYIFGVPLRPYSYMIVDEEVLLSEYDRYNRSGVSLPDHLIVNRANSGNSLQDSKVQVLIEHHLQQLDSIFELKEPVTSKEIQEAALRLAFNEWDSAIQSRTPEEKEKVKRGIKKKHEVYHPGERPDRESKAR